jgi:hypothetical protein
LSKEDGDNFMSVMDNTEDQVQISMSFHFLQESFIAKMMFLLQVDNYDSYKLLNSFKEYIALLQNDMSFKVHYKVFKNTPLDSSGYISNNNAQAIKNVTYIGSNYYFVVRDNSFDKNEMLFLETLRQMCINSVSQALYFDYMKTLQENCFEGPDQDGNFNPLKDFTDCTGKIYSDLVEGKNPNKNKEILACTDLEGDIGKELLDDNEDLIQFYMMNYTPLIFINNHLYKGNFEDTLHLVEAVCMTFEEPPSECSKLEIFTEYQDFSSSSLFNYFIKTLMYLLILFVVIVVVFYFYYKRKMKKKIDSELQSKINSAIMKYYGKPDVQNSQSHQIDFKASLTEEEVKIEQENGN